MKLLTPPFHHALLALSFLPSLAIAARKPANSALLSTIQSLTLRANQKTSHRRVPAIPQLKCVGGNACGLYEVDVMRCRNSGADYDPHDIQWTCTASLPAEFKLGATDVICEGYDSPDDPYVLKGSCGVEYRLVLTEEGEEKYGRRGGGYGFGSSEEGGSGLGGLFPVLFWGLFLGVLCFILYGAYSRWASGTNNDGRPPPPWRGGGGGGGGGNDDDDPPPPYDYQPPRKPHQYTSYMPGQARSQTQQSQQQGWRPGFWTGALGGAAATYMANRAATNRAEQPRTVYGAPGGGRGGSTWWDNGEGSSSGGRRSSPSGYGGSARYESTGFGSTRRR